MGKGPIRVELEHHVLPTPGGGSRATMRVLGAAAAPLQPYRFLASAALRNLVTQESPASQAGRVAEGVATFPFVFAPSYGAAGRPFGVSPRTTGVEVSSTWLHVRYGHWRLMTPRSNITSTTVTGDFSFAKTAGPPHLPFADPGGVSFTTNGDRALCLAFRDPVVALDPTGTIRHPRRNARRDGLRGPRRGPRPAAVGPQGRLTPPDCRDEYRRVGAR